MFAETTVTEAPAVAAESTTFVERPFVPGIYYDMEAEHYHSVEAMSASGAKKMLRSPQHFKLMRDTPSAPTPVMQVGTAVHCGVLEGDFFSSRIVSAPTVDKRTSAGKSAWAEFVASSAGKLVLSADDFDRAQHCIGAVRDHVGARALLDGAQTEVSLFWNDRQFNVPCKARFDARNHGGIIDLKTCVNAEREAFSRAIATFMYNVQGAAYFSGAEHVLDATPQFFVFIAVESEPPFAVACYELASEAILAGLHQWNVALERYAAALSTGQFVGYPQTIEPISVPKWALRFDL